MGAITIHAGDFPPGKGSTNGGIISMEWAPGDRWTGKSITLIGNLESIAATSEEEVKKVGGTLGWGIAGATLLGPVGLLAGLLLGGKGKDVTFIAHFKDGKKMLATADLKSFTKMQALVF
jgi:hypothetical protein